MFRWFEKRIEEYKEEKKRGMVEFWIYYKSGEWKWIIGMEILKKMIEVIEV